MWKYTELDAYNTISLHDCKATSITMEGSNLIFDFPDGFWITPASKHINHDHPIKTGPAQLCIRGVFKEAPFDAIDIYIISSSKVYLYHTKFDGPSMGRDMGLSYLL